MKASKRIFALLAAVVFLFLLLPFGASAAPAKDRFGRSVLQQMAGGSRLVAAYDALATGAEQVQENIPVPGGSNAITKDELSTVVDALWADYPEFFWLGRGYGYSYENTAPYRVTQVSFAYTMTGSALAQAKSQFDSKLNELVQGLSGKSDYEISKLLHDRVAAAVQYDLSVSSEQDAYGALVKGRAVCAGYARAYQCLLLKMGIEAWYVSGVSIKPSTGASENHAWNLVKLDGQWYYTDVTWDDQGQNVHYAYLNQTWARMSEDHTPTVFAQYLPKSTATANNYFVKNGGLLGAFDAAALAQRLLADGMTTRLYITGDTEAFRNALAPESNIRAILKALGHENAGFSFSSQNLGREFVLTLNIIEASHRHQLTPVSEQPATCHAPGRRAYFTCSCGKWFSDAGAVNEINDKESLTVPALTHAPSSWQLDAQSHWRVCTRTGCGTEIVNSRAGHTDANADAKCDTCSAAVARPEPPTPPPTNPATAPATQPTQPIPTQPPAVDPLPSIEATLPTRPTSPPPSGEPEPSEEPTGGATRPTGEPGGTDGSTEPGGEAPPSMPDGSESGTQSSPPWGLLGAGAAIILLAGIGLPVFFKRRKA